MAWITEKSAKNLQDEDRGIEVLECNGMVDPISLICSLQEEEDERIQMSLEEVRGEIDTWQIMKN